MAVKIEIYTTRTCPFCMRAKALLNGKKVSYEEISVDGKAELRAAMTKRAGSHTVPQIWINDQHIGGCTDLQALDRAGKLDTLLAVGKDDDR